jgi:gluconolactonase
VARKSSSVAETPGAPFSDAARSFGKISEHDIMLSMAIETLAQKVGFTEGPVWTHDGRLLVTSISRGRLYEIPLDGKEPRQIAETGGGPNGAAALADGSVWVAQNGGHVITELPEPVVPPGIQRIENGEATYAADTDLQAPNDLAFGPGGELWFTDPYPRMIRDDPVTGRIWRLDPQTGEKVLVNGALYHPNGLAVSPDGSELFVAETIRKRVWRFPISDTSLGDGTLFAQLKRGEPDGIAFDAEGRLHVACHGDYDGIVVLTHEGDVAETIDLEDAFPTNVCFAGEDLRLLVVTAPKGGRAIGIDRDVPGLPLFGTA